MDIILKHFETWSPFYSGIGGLTTGLALFVGTIGLFFSWRSLEQSRKSVAIAQKSIDQQIEWQQRITEKQIYFQVILSEWNLETQAWNEAQKSSPGVKPSGSPPSLVEKLIKAGVFKREQNPQ